jgi:hypothetical protein
MEANVQWKYNIASLTSHKECSGVAPIKDFTTNVKSSPSMLDLEQTLNELGSFVRRLTDDKQKKQSEHKKSSQVTDKF